MKAMPPNSITLPQFSLAFVTFGVLLVLALLWPETTLDDVDLGRTKATIWVTSLMLLPSLALYPYRTLSQRMANVVHLFWTFAYLLFLVHAYWAIFVIFNGLKDTFVQMGIPIASINFLLVILWGLDVLLLWFAPSRTPPAARFQIAVRTLTFLIFATTFLFLRSGPVHILGIIFAAVISLSLAIRLWVRERAVQY
ncbi:hypothetical protein PYR71_28390 [Rhizobium sp. MC63]|uniref:Ferric reductase like transmembrane component n=5 Tax=Rhizobium TaxID=379 RepID=A0A1C3Y9V2_9HYPH|nr:MULTISPECIES: hypothetical protein [Rhizobium]ANK88267.1 hypothetical protein AMK02_PC00021 [Rhizobium sp. N731]ANL18513.1 hypothetical protein AMJ97_PC00021 [Rhizobium sp. N1314]ANL37103.1 hypothetical protein AMC89_PC00021 [Rhizobium phaseoli]ANL43481.1 hypothetical protein AMC88_PC00021 [Rhizobium phaseoli]ANL62467.1 hypothetical protein AMC85_PC00021 [Rhizobium phaseoli]